MNLKTFNLMLKNTNASDLGGDFVKLLAGDKSLARVNEIMSAGGRPKIRIINDGYFNPSAHAGSSTPAAITRFSPDNKVLFVGNRIGEGKAVGEYQMTRNMENPGQAPGLWNEIILEQEPPRRPVMYMGHNGGPVVFRPKSLVLLSVTL